MEPPLLLLLPESNVHRVLMLRSSSLQQAGSMTWSTMHCYTRVRDHAEIANPASMTTKPISVTPVNTTISR